MQGLEDKKYGTRLGRGLGQTFGSQGAWPSLVGCTREPLKDSEESEGTRSVAEGHESGSRLEWRQTFQEATQPAEGLS